MRQSNLFTSVAVLALGAALAQPASAQRVVVFGDSLSDTGNVAALGGVVSPQGRFSNGLNWIDILYGPTTLTTFTGITTGNVDLAFGGARADGLANPTPGGVTTPGVPNQIATFQGFGGKIGAADTVVVWAGANNVFQFFTSTPPVNVNSTTISVNSAIAAGAVVIDINTLINAGGRRFIVPNLPDIGSTPSFAGALSSAGTLASSAFNASLQGGLQNSAANNPGVNIIQADIASLFRHVIANASAFGFTNTTGACSTGAPFIANCQGFVFADGVHPTQAAYALIAQYVGLLSNSAPAIAQTARLGETGIYANEVITNQVFDRMSAFISGTYADRNGPYAEIIGAYAQYDKSGTTPGLQFQLGGIRAGIDKKDGATLFGGSVTVLDGAQSTGSLKSDIQSYRGDLYATALYGNVYVSGDVGISSLSYTGLKRDTGFPTVTASGKTQGLVATAAAEVGFAQRLGAFTIIPSGRVTYFHSQLDAYDESADILAMSFAERTSDSVLLAGKVRAVTPIAGFGVSATVFGEIGYEGFVSSSTSDLKSTFVNNTALPTIVKAGDPNGPGVIGKLGLSSQVTEGTFLDFQYGIAVHDGGGETHSGDIRLKATY